MRIILRALSYEMVYAWQRHFAGEAGVSCEQGDIFGRTADAIAARQMRAAYDVVVLGKIETKGGLARAVEGHIALVK